MPRLFWMLTVAAMVFGVAGLNGHDKAPPKKAPKPDPKRVKELMKRKLDNAQKVLEALVLNDLPKAALHADKLRQLPKEEGWKVVNSAEYELWSDSFRKSLDSLTRASKEKNLERAKLAYLGMTMACFNCHSYVRDLGDTSVPAGPRAAR